MPTSHPRHSITETPALAAALAPLRARLGEQTPSLSDLVAEGAAARLRDLEAQDRARSRTLETFVDRLTAAPQPDLAAAERIRRADRRP